MSTELARRLVALAVMVVVGGLVAWGLLLEAPRPEPPTFNSSSLNR